MSSHYKDLRDVYAKTMEFHGCGFALFQPIASEDMRVPSVGYFDRNGDWNNIRNLSTRHEDMFPYMPLAYEPLQTSEIGIEWQPKTSIGTSAHVIGASADTPDTLPGGAGANANIQYSSADKFGAVLMTVKPITLTAYNNERLFTSWLEENKSKIYELHADQMKRYGMWMVTRTYSAPGCSINAWFDSNKSATVTLKAKAAMLGELGEDLDWNDKLTDRDWSHYKAKSPAGVVIFMDGIEVKPVEWRLEGFRQSLSGVGRSASRRRSNSATPATARLNPDETSTQLTPPRYREEMVRLGSGEETLQPTPPQKLWNAPRSSTYKPRPVSWAVNNEADANTLRDVGAQHQLSRSRSPSWRGVPSVQSIGSIGSTPRTPSLRRETRSVSFGNS